MLIDIVKKASTDRSVIVKILNLDGTPATGVVYNTPGIDLWYRREGAAKTSITEVTLATLATAHADGGFLHVGDGVYRLDLPDAAIATGANYVDIGGTVTDMVVLGGRVRLINVDLEDATAAAADDAVLAAIAALNNLSSAQAQTAAAAALTAYDPPTNAEMEARTLTAALIAKLSAHLGGVLTVNVGSGSTTTALVFHAASGINGAVPSATNDFYNGRVIVFLTGTLAGQATAITDYVGGTGTATIAAVTSAPQSGDTAVMV